MKNRDSVGATESPCFYIKIQKKSPSALFLLAESEYSENLSYENIIETLNSLDCVYTDKYKAEFVELVEKIS